MTGEESMRKNAPFRRQREGAFASLHHSAIKIAFAVVCTTLQAIEFLGPVAAGEPRIKTSVKFPALNETFGRKFAAKSGTSGGRLPSTASLRRQLQFLDGMLDESPGSRLAQQKQIVSLVEEEDREGLEHSVSGEEMDEIAVSLARHTHAPGEWTMHKKRDPAHSAAGKYFPHSAYEYDSEEGRAREAASVAELARAGTFNLTDPTVRAFSRLVDGYLIPWTRIEGVALGMGSTGMISPDLLQTMSMMPLIMEGCAQIRVVEGKVYFRHGGSMFHWFRYRRLAQTVKMIQDAVDKYKLTQMRVEFFLNMRDVPMSFDNSLEGQKAGYPVFSVEKAVGSIDIVYPDPVDLADSYTAETSSTTPWADKHPRAVFRGATTNYPLKAHYNWRVNPRLRIHRMTDARPDLIDARVMKWSHVSSLHTKKRLADDQLEVAPVMSREETAQYKYEVVIDGAAGSSRTCNALGSDQVMIKQQSQYSEFFWPLLRPYEHYIPTTHFFDDLFAQVEWARSHDKEAHEMVKNANKVARHVCTWDGRTLYWAILLFKYWRNALENPNAVEVPQDLCEMKVNPVAIKKPRLIKELPKPPENWPPLCTEEELKTVQQPECTFYCRLGNMRGLPQIWVPASAVDSVARSTLKKVDPDFNG